MKYLGIDYGEAKVGLAVGDEESRLALPYSIIKNKGRANLLKELSAVCQKEGIGKIIVGLPANTQAKGATIGEEKVKRFIKDLQTAVKLKVEAVSEVFSTKQARKLTAGQKTKGRDDAVAAMIILQSYLDNRIYN